MRKNLLTLTIIIIFLALSSCGNNYSTNISADMQSPTTSNNSVSSTPPQPNGTTTTTLRVLNTPSLIITDANKGLTQIALSPNGKMFATVGNSADGTAKLWNIKGELIARLSGKIDVIYGPSSLSGSIPNSIAWSPNSETIATSVDSKEVQLWDTTGKLKETLSGHTDKVSSLDWSPNGQFLASGSIDKNVILWNKDGKQIALLQGYKAPINKITWSPNSNILATIASQFMSSSQIVEDNSIRLWDNQGRLIKTVTSISKHNYSNMAWTSDGKVLAIGSEENSVTLYKPDGTLIKDFATGGDGVGAMVWSPDGKILAIGNGDESVGLWSRAGEPLATLNGGSNNIIGALAWSPDGRILACGSGDGSITLWSATGQSIKTLRNSTNIAPITTLNWSSDGTNLIAGSYLNGDITFWR